MWRHFRGRGATIIRSTVGVLLVGALHVGAPLPVRAAAYTVTVNDATDIIHASGCATSGAGMCSLRDSILYANTRAADSGTITLQAATYPLTIPGTAEDGAMTGDLDVAAHITINGAGANATIIQGGASLATSVDRVFDLFSGAALTLSGVTITNGQPPLLHNGGFAIDSSGGGIRNVGGTVVLVNSVVTGNRVGGGDAVGGYGGGIVSSGSLTLTNSTVSNNAVVVALASVQNGNFTIDGGGVHNTGFLTLRNSTINGNTLSVTVPTTNTGFADGGGILSSHSGHGNLTVTASTISNNTITVSSDPGFSNATRGGGVYIYGSATLTNSTISGNQLNDVNGGTFALVQGGAIYLEGGGSVDVIAGTIAANSSGGYNQDGSRSIAYRDSLLDNTGANCAGRTASNDYNLASDASCTTLTQPHDLPPATDPRIGPLAANGGPAQTHALLDNSPAIDRIPLHTNFCGDSLTTDQRGVPRPQPAAGSCDIGAYEFQLANPNPLPIPKPIGPIGGQPSPLPNPPQPSGPIGGPPAPLPPRRP